MRIAINTIAVIAATFAIGVLVYVAVSFVHLVRHTQPRPKRVAFREAAREGLWAILVQPLLPFFFVVGRRMGGPSSGIPVVLVHGYMQNRIDFLRIARVLARRGRGPLYGINYAWWRPIYRCVESLAAFVERVQEETGAARVDLVCHSMGGNVAIEYASGPGRDAVRRIATIASPHSGISWQGPVVGVSGRELRSGSSYFQARPSLSLPVPVLSIASTHDNVVHPPATSELSHRGGADMQMHNLGHFSLLFDPTVAETIADFLSTEDANATPQLRGIPTQGTS